MVKSNATDSPNDKSKNAVLFLSRLPYGFDDEAARKFFSQFGEIKGVCFPRSKKTARSRGYMFVLFQDREVAEIAAGTMNDYMMFGKLLKATVLPENSKIVYDRFVKESRKFRFVPWQKLFAKKFNTLKTDEQMERKMARLLQHDGEKVKRFQELGIEYQFRTYASLLEE